MYDLITLQVGHSICYLRRHLEEAAFGWNLQIVLVSWPEGKHLICFLKLTALPVFHQEVSKVTIFHEFHKNKDRLRFGHHPNQPHNVFCSKSEVKL